MQHPFQDRLLISNMKQVNPNVATNIPLYKKLDDPFVER